MSDKIKAYFGADVSGVELEMLKAQRATKAYERAVKSLEGTKGPTDLTASLAKGNEQLAKSMNLLRGGAIGAGITLILGKMMDFADHAKSLGDSASEAQKSAAKWGDEFKSFGDTIKGASASVLGTLAGWGRDIGEKFRDPTDRAYDDVAASSEESAKRQVDALAKAKKAHEDAAKEIPALQKKLQGEKRETELDQLGEQGRLMTELYEIEKELSDLASKGTTAVNEKRKLELLIEQEKMQRRLGEVREKLTSEDESKQIKADENITDSKVGSIGKVSDAQKEADDLRYERAWKFASDEQKISQVRKEGRAAQAAYDKDRSAENLVALEKARGKWIDLRDQIQGAKKDTQSVSGGGDKLATGGRERGEDGKLRRNGVVISDEDATSTEATKSRNEKLQSEAKRGEIKGGKGIDDSGEAVAQNTADLLKELKSLTSKFN